MAVTEKAAERNLTAQIWGIGVRHIVYMALGAALYGGLSWVTNSIQLPSAGSVSLRPAIVIPIFFGVVFGPWVGLFTGGVGNILGDLISGYGFFWNWDVGNGLIGFVPGLALYLTAGRYRSIRNIVIAEVFAVLGIVVGIGFAAYSQMLLERLDFPAGLSIFTAASLSNLVNALILLPILLFAYTAAVERRGR